MRPIRRRARSRGVFPCFGKPAYCCRAARAEAASKSWPRSLVGANLTSAADALKLMLLQKPCWMGPIKSPSESLHDLRQEPRPPLGLVNPDLDQTGGRHVIVFIASLMCRTKITRQRLIIGVELREHFFRGNAPFVVVLQALMP